MFCVEELLCRTKPTPSAHATATTALFQEQAGTVCASCRLKFDVEPGGLMTFRRKQELLVGQLKKMSKDEPSLTRKGEGLGRCERRSR